MFQGLTTPLHRLADVCLPPLPFVASVTMKGFVLVLCALVAIAYAFTDDDVKKAAEEYVKRLLFYPFPIESISYHKSDNPLLKSYYGENAYDVIVTLDLKVCLINIVCLFVFLFFFVFLFGGLVVWWFGGLFGGLVVCIVCDSCVAADL